MASGADGQYVDPVYHWRGPLNNVYQSRDREYPSFTGRNRIPEEEMSLLQRRIPEILDDFQTYTIRADRHHVHC